MKVLIVDNDGNLIKNEAEIIVLLSNPDTFPAIKTFPAKADLRAWHDRHDALMDRREGALKIYNLNTPKPSGQSHANVVSKTKMEE